MRIARFARGDGVAYGIVEGEAAAATIAELHGHPFGVDPGAVRLTGRVYPLAEVRLLAPVLPSKVVGVAAELFLKPSTAVTGPADAIRYPVKLADRVTFSGQLAVIIGRLCHQVPRERADEVVFGYSCATDVTAGGLDVTRAKAFDTFCPLGPWMETGALPADFGITSTVNGTVRASSQTAPDVPELISYVTEVMTLLPGDVLLTGPASDGGQLNPGDEVAVTIAGIGTLTSKVIAG
ncbi:MAG TPA: fumarylacetoacetate hydrolase family protein [Streptosporangiaceae bacterium]|nr:fumarylacetoacetate hydrolase family protein [Streptosporangiaceae bacterium]